MTESIPVTYPSKATNEILKKKHKEKLLKDNPETLYSDLYRNGEVSNIIFYTEDPESYSTQKTPKPGTLQSDIITPQ